MRYLIIFMLLVGVFVLGKRSCHYSMFGVNGSGPVKTESRTETNFHTIDLDLNGDVEVRVADQFSITVQAQENLLPLLKTEVKDGSLHIYFSERVSHSENVKIMVSGPAFDNLSVSGSGAITVVNMLQADRLNLSIAGSGDVKIPQGTIGSLECSIAGSGGIELGGTANASEVHISGSGDVDAKQMTINDLRADISGSGSVTAHVVQVLKGSISGSGDIFYSGEPSVERSISGSGTIQKQ